MITNKNQIIYAGLLFLFSVALYGCMHFLSRASAVERSRVEAEYKAEAAREGARLVLKNELLAVKEKSAVLSGYFFDKENINELINLLESLGVESRVSVVTERLAKAEGKTGTLSFVLSAKGSEAGLVSYVERLERAPYLLALEAVSLGRSGEGIDEWRAEIRLSAVGYEE